MSKEEKMTKPLKIKELSEGVFEAVFEDPTQMFPITVAFRNALWNIKDKGEFPVIVRWEVITNESVIQMHLMLLGD